MAPHAFHTDIHFLFKTNSCSLHHSRILFGVCTHLPASGFFLFIIAHYKLEETLYVFCLDITGAPYRYPNLSHVAIGTHIKPPINCQGPWRPSLSVQLSLHSRPKLYQPILSSIRTNSIFFHLLCMWLFHFGLDGFLTTSFLNSSR